jgi:hypothetical protein
MLCIWAVLTTVSTILFELFQKPHVVVEHKSDVVERIHQRTHSFKAETECETRVYLRVDANAFEHVRVDHTGAAELYPA